MELVYNENHANIKEVGWAFTICIFCKIVNYNTFMQVGIILFTFININIQAQDFNYF